jgi:hypothetical protein
VLNLLHVIDELNQTVLLENASLSDAVWKYDYTQPILDALVPCTPIDASICPLHLPVALLGIAKVIAAIHTASLPLKFTEPVFFVVLILPHVGV